MSDFSIIVHTILTNERRRDCMHKEKSVGRRYKEKAQLQAEDQKTENVFENKSRAPNEQNAFKETQFKRGE